MMESRMLPQLFVTESKKKKNMIIRFIIVSSKLEHTNVDKMAHLSII